MMGLAKDSVSVFQISQFSTGLSSATTNSRVQTMKAVFALVWIVVRFLPTPIAPWVHDGDQMSRTLKDGTKEYRPLTREEAGDLYF